MSLSGTMSHSGAHTAESSQARNAKPSLGKSKSAVAMWPGMTFIGTKEERND